VKIFHSNGPYHILGQHNQCASYFCKGAKIGKINLVPEAEKCGLLREINQIYSRIIDNTPSLLLDVDNNICEQFNSLINIWLESNQFFPNKFV